MSKSMQEQYSQDELDNILDRLAVRMYDEGQLDKPSLMGRQVAIVNINEAKAQLNQLLIKERLVRGIYELERLEYIPQMHGDWQKVIDDRITKLESELASLENQIKVRNRQRAEQRANLREDK